MSDFLEKGRIGTGLRQSAVELGADRFELLAVVVSRHGLRPRTPSEALEAFGANALGQAAVSEVPRAARTLPATSVKPAGSVTARSASILRSRSMPALFSPSMNWL